MRGNWNLGILPEATACVNVIFAYIYIITFLDLYYNFLLFLWQSVNHLTHMQYITYGIIDHV